MERLVVLARQAKDQNGKLAIAGQYFQCLPSPAFTDIQITDHLQLITLFVQIVTPYVEPGQENPAVKYCQEIFPILAEILTTFIDFIPICERICRNWRYMVISYRTAMAPLLAQMANTLAEGFALSKQGCFLWVTAAILREFSEDRDHVDEGTTDAIYTFFESQSKAMLRIMNDLPPQDVPDVIEDFFRLLVDALLYYPHKLIQSSLFPPIFEAGVSALGLQQRDPLNAVLHYVRDVIGYGGDNPPSSSSSPNPPEIQNIVQKLILANGENLVKQIMAGMMITFPDDCFSDGSGALLGLFELMPEQTERWVDKTVRMLPAGTIREPEIDRLMTGIRERLALGRDGHRKVRSLLQDFTNSYRRRYIAPRDGLGKLEGPRFHFDA